MKQTSKKSVLGIYIRVSTAKQADKGLSADQQKLAGIKLANELGWDYKLYDDRGVSGSKISFKDRYLNELLNDCKKDKKSNKAVLDGIFCVDIDRWSRDKNYEEGQVIITLIKESGVKVFTPTGEYKLSDPSVEFMLRLKSLFASFEVNNRVGSIERNLRRSAELGRIKGGALLPYGYKQGDNKMMVIDDYEAKVVKQIYKMASEGKGTKVIAGYLNNKGYQTKAERMGRGMTVRGVKKYKFVWRDKVVYDILTNSLYKGERKHKGEIFKCPAIIDGDLFDFIQDELKGRNQFKDTTNKYQYLLKGLIECPNCGKKIQGKKRANGKDNCYTCTSNRLGPNCGNKGINIEYLNELVCSNVLQLDDIVLEAFSSEEIAKKTKEFKETLKRIDSCIITLEDEQSTLIDLSIKTKNNTAVAKKLDDIQKSLDHQNEWKTNVEKELQIEDEKDTLLAVANEGIKHFKTLKKHDDKVVFLHSIIEKITIRWDAEYYTYDICILFKLNQLQRYLFSKEIVINRTGRQDGKSVTKVLSEKVTLCRSVHVDEDDFIIWEQSEANYTKYINQHTRIGKKRLVIKKAS